LRLGVLHVNRYLGTVTAEGAVVEEPDLMEAE